jgi:hypothetical protein
MEVVKQKPNKFKYLKLFIIISTLFSIVFNVTFIYFFVNGISDESGNLKCQTLIKWDTALFISLAIYLVLSCIQNLFKLVKIDEPTIDNTMYKVVTSFISLVSIATFVCWIGTQVEYYKLERNQEALVEDTNLAVSKLPKSAEAMESSMESHKTESSGHVCNNLGTINYVYFMTTYVCLALCLVVGLYICCRLCMVVAAQSEEEPTLIDNENKNETGQELQDKENN